MSQKRPLILPCFASSPRISKKLLYPADLPLLHHGQRRLTSLLSQLSAPLIRSEARRFFNSHTSHELPEQHVYILGHWRSGTTWLHYVLSQSSEVSYVDYWQGFAPEACLGTHPLRPMLQWLMPSTRPMDDMEMRLDLPQEDEIALLHSTGGGVYRCHYHPSRLWQYWQEESSLVAQKSWYDCMQTQVIKAQIRHPGSTYISKNPANILRFPTIRQLDPSARFIHIMRDWSEVYLSTCRLYDQVLPMTAISNYNREDLRAQVRKIMLDYANRWQSARSAIPSSQLYECHYDELCHDPEKMIGDLCSWMQISPDNSTHRSGVQRKDYRAQLASLSLVERRFLREMDQKR